MFEECVIICRWEPECRGKDARIDLEVSSSRDAQVRSEFDSGREGFEIIGADGLTITRD